MKDTGQNIRETGQFTVCLVNHDSSAAMNVTAIDFPPEVDEIAAATLTTVPRTQITPPPSTTAAGPSAATTDGAASIATTCLLYTSRCV